jgi:hypothetical protein
MTAISLLNPTGTSHIDADVLGFENHFLEHYKGFLLEELSHADESVRNFAVWVMGMLLYQDPDIIEVLDMVKAGANTRLQ